MSNDELPTVASVVRSLADKVISPRLAIERINSIIDAAKLEAFDHGVAAAQSLKHTTEELSHDRQDRSHDRSPT